MNSQTQKSADTAAVSTELVELEYWLAQRLRAMDVPFRNDGLPLFPVELLLRKIPPDADIMTFADRSCIDTKKLSLLCAYAKDDIVLRRIKLIDKDVPIYQDYYGFCGFDLSPRGNMSIEIQRRNIRINAMANTLLALLSGKKMLANFRIGSILTLDTLSLYPKGIPYAVGALGCARGNTEYNKAYLRTKLAYAQPSELLIYGRLRDPYREVLEEEQIPYRVFPDFRQRSYARKVG